MRKDINSLRRYVARFNLRDNRQVLLRPIRPSDEPLMNELFKTFSEETVMYRFFGVIREMSHRELVRYCNVDQEKEVAIVAEIGENGRRRLIGVVRLAIEPNGKTGEIAFVVGDPWQNLGLGSKMVDYLIEIGKTKKLDTIYALMLRENYRAIQFLQKRGFRIEYLESDSVKGILNLRSKHSWFCLHNTMRLSKHTYYLVFLIHQNNNMSEINNPSTPIETSIVNRTTNIEANTEKKPIRKGFNAFSVIVSRSSCFGCEQAIAKKIEENNKEIIEIAKGVAIR